MEQELQRDFNIDLHIDLRTCLIRPFLVCVTWEDDVLQEAAPQVDVWTQYGFKEALMHPIMVVSNQLGLEENLWGSGRRWEIEQLHYSYVGKIVATSSAETREGKIGNVDYW